MKLIQLNLWDGRLIHNALKFLKGEDADIINFQEVTVGMTSGHFYFSAYDRLQKALGDAYGHCYYSPQTSGRFAGRKVSFGVLIMSKYPIVYKKTVCIAGRPREGTEFETRDMNTRVLQHVKIDVDGETVNDLNYHGYFIWGTKEGSRAMNAHSEKIARYMQSLNQKEKIILSADFNLAPASGSLKIISRHYPDLVSRYRIKTTRNELSIPQEPVDNILVNNAVKVRSLRVPKVYVSDHLPMVLEFD